MKHTIILLSVLACVYSLHGQKITPENPNIVLQRMLREPTAAEVHQVLKERRAMDLTSRNVLFHDTLDISFTRRLYIVSHTVEGHQHFGAIVVPFNTSRSHLPIIVMATGGDGMHSEFDLTQDFNHQAVRYPAFLGDTIDNHAIIAVPSFRGQELIIGDRRYHSGGDVSDAFDGATTDALALLEVVLSRIKGADANRIAFYGGSRGGAVALLASARDKRVKRAIAIAAPSDAKELYGLYPDQFRLLFFNAYLQGKISEADARKKFIACSPIYFVHELPFVQVHHDNGDPFLPVSFANKLVNALKSRGKSVQAFYYDEGIHGYWSDPQFSQHVQRFLLPLLGSN